VFAIGESLLTLAGRNVVLDKGRVLAEVGVFIFQKIVDVT
jgi:hypothetical protein